MNKFMVIGSIAVLMSAAKASPRKAELMRKLSDAKIIEKQNYQQMLAAKRKYHSSENYADKLARELKDLVKREAAEVKAYKDAHDYGYTHVNPYLTNEYDYPTEIKLREVK